MPRVTFTDNIQRHVDCPSCEAPGSTVREVLDAVFEANPPARGYVLDDRGSVRRHMTIFVNGTAIRDRDRLSDRVAGSDEIHVMQALSGG